MGRYAEKTSVSSDKSRAEIEATLRRYGADQFHYGWTEQGAMIAFRAYGRSVKFLLPMPDHTADEFTKTPGRGLTRHPDDALKAYEQAVRQRWRALTLCIKAKLEAVEAGIVTFDDEFLAHFLLPGGQTIGQKWKAEYAALVDGGKIPSLLPPPPQG